MDGSKQKTLSELIAEIALSSSKPKHQQKAAETFSSKAEKAEQVRQSRIRNDILESDQNMKKYSLIALFVLLGLETVAIFVLVFFQGFTLWGFHIEEWNFRLVIAGTLIQITAMLEVAIRHLFPPTSGAK